MAAYLIGQVIVHDQERFAPYVDRTSALIAHYGGEVLDVVRAVEAVEGEWPIGAMSRSASPCRKQSHNSVRELRAGSFRSIPSDDGRWR